MFESKSTSLPFTILNIEFVESSTSFTILPSKFNMSSSRNLKGFAEYRFTIAANFYSWKSSALGAIDNKFVFARRFFQNHRKIDIS